MDNKNTANLEMNYSIKAVATQLAIFKMQQEWLMEEDNDRENLHADKLAEKFVDYRDRIIASLNFTHRF